MIRIPDTLSLDRCVVCVPARNEAVALPRLVAALARQELCRDGGRLRLVVAANNCTDGTVPVLRGLATRYPALRLHVLELSLPPETAHVGVARARAMAGGAAWLREEGVEDGILLGTDADTRPPPHWVAANLAALAGADCVGGRIVIEDSGENPAPGWLRMMRERVDAYWSAVRELAHAIDPLPHDPPPRHGDHTGASLALLVRWYEAAGGVPPLPVGEDNALVAAVERAGGRLRHAPDVWVEVSARQEGRASGGMAGEMRRWRLLAESGSPHLLPGAGFWRRAFGRRRILRGAFYRGSWAEDAARLGLSGEVLARLALESPNDIAFVARAEPLLPPLPAEEAEIQAATGALEAMSRALSGTAEAV